MEGSTLEGSNGMETGCASDFLCDELDVIKYLRRNNRLIKLIDLIDA